MLERGGNIKGFHIDTNKYYDIAEKVLANVKIGSTIITDEFCFRYNNRSNPFIFDKLISNCVL